MEIKKFINNLIKKFGEDKRVYIKCFYIDEEDGESHECISGLQPQDFRVNPFFSKTTLVSQYNENKDYTIVDSLDKVSGMTVKEIKEYLSQNFDELEQIYTDGRHFCRIDNKDFHTFHDGILIEYDRDDRNEEDAIKNASRADEYPLINRNPDYNSLLKKMTVGDLKEWLAQYDDNLPIMLEGCNSRHEYQYPLSTYFLRKDQYYVYDKKSKENLSVNAIFIG